MPFKPFDLARGNYSHEVEETDKEENKEAEPEEESPFGDFSLEAEGGTGNDSYPILSLTKDLKSQVGNAIRTFEMIKEGDRVLIALSGGKDSLALVHILRYFQSVSPVKFEIGAVTVDPQVKEFNPKPLEPYMHKIGVPYFIESEPIVERAAECMKRNSICAFCSRMKRGLIYSCARREKYNVIAMGQHLDDLGESFVMSAFHNGVLRTMKANYTIDAGDLRVIRPLVFCRESLFSEFAKKHHLPVIVDNCPACFSAPKERHRVKLMLAQQEHLFPALFSSILKTIMPLMKNNLKELVGEGGDSSDDEKPEKASNLEYLITY